MHAAVEQISVPSSLSKAPGPDGKRFILFPISHISIPLGGVHSGDLNSIDKALVNAYIF